MLLVSLHNYEGKINWTENIPRIMQEMLYKMEERRRYENWNVELTKLNCVNWAKIKFSQETWYDIM